MKTNSRRKTVWCCRRCATKWDGLLKERDNEMSCHWCNGGKENIGTEYCVGKEMFYTTLNEQKAIHGSFKKMLEAQ